MLLICEKETLIETHPLLRKGWDGCGDDFGWFLNFLGITVKINLNFKITVKLKNLVNF
jgi:hypothetical protein